MKKPASESILQPGVKECYICRKRYGTSAVSGLEQHHIYAGRNRKVSDENGFWVWLLPIWHTGSRYAVHGYAGAALDLELKQDCQRKFEETQSREEFRKLIGRSYI